MGGATTRPCECRCSCGRGVSPSLRGRVKACHISRSAIQWLIAIQVSVSPSGQDGTEQERQPAPPVTKSLLRLDPEYDVLRAHKDFQALL